MLALALTLVATTCDCGPVQVWVGGDTEWLCVKEDADLRPGDLVSYQNEHWIVDHDPKVQGRGESYAQVVRAVYSKVHVEGMKVYVVPGHTRGTFIEYRILDPNWPGKLVGTDAYKAWLLLARVTFISTVDVGQPLSLPALAVRVR